MSATAGRYSYNNRTNDLVIIIEAGWRLISAVLPNAILFMIFCAVWASVFLTVLSH